MELSFLLDGKFDTLLDSGLRFCQNLMRLVCVFDGHLVAAPWLPFSLFNPLCTSEGSIVSNDSLGLKLSHTKRTANHLGYVQARRATVCLPN